MMRQEPHRVYWQQWSTTPNEEQQQQPQIVTKSAAVRISDAARATDVTQLLRRTLRTTLDGNTDKDALVLVATLLNVPPIQFPHEVVDTNESPDSLVSEPFHVITTLKPQDKPLNVRDALLVKLQQHPTLHTLSPKLQWFFVPCSSQMPNYIQLDGYCTDDESECNVDNTNHNNNDYDESDSKVNGHDKTDNPSNTHTVQFNDEYWWRTEQDAIFQQDNEEPHSNHIQQQLHQEEEGQWNSLRNAPLASLLDPHYVSGYLLKRSNKDPHVWKRVYCILTDQHFWSFSRLVEKTDNTKRRTAHQFQLSLHRTSLVLEETTTTNTAFQLFCKNETCHVFRAATRAKQQEWIQCLQARITQCQDNDWIQHAELIVQDEALARSKRRMTVAVEPLVNTLDNGDNRMQRFVLLWGMQVAEFRETCRHLQSRMPTAKQPVVVASSFSSNNANHSTDLQSLLLLESNPQPQQEEHVLENDTRSMIQSAWKDAAVLLARATYFTQTAMTSSSSFEMQCAHVDKIISRQFRSSSQTSDLTTVTADATERSVHPPPADLFDSLLVELQSRCALKQMQDGTLDGHARETPLARSS